MSVGSAPDEGAARSGGVVGEDWGGGGGGAGSAGGGQRSAAVRIRRKLILLHTLFTVALAAVLLPAFAALVGGVVSRAESSEARLALGLILAASDGEPSPSDAPGELRLRLGTREALELPAELERRARSQANEILTGRLPGGRPVAVVFQADREADAPGLADPSSGRFVSLEMPASAAREAARESQLLLVAALLAIYGFIALVLELVILPRQVYQPIERLRRADAAVQLGDRGRELIPEREIGRDELGEIMRSRNASILKLREQEEELNAALNRVETVAAELKQKNDLIETARRNLADQDRLASLGMMSAGIAHEINTPLAVLKGSVQKIAENPASADGARLALMQRVLGRLERLSESLLDFARVREPAAEPTAIRSIVEEAWHLVTIDRGSARIVFDDQVAESAVVTVDADRMTQVFVNLLRNAVDATGGRGRVSVTAERVERSGQAYMSVRVIDNGPGIDPEIFPTLFEPFASTNLDAQGTGLGLAVSEGIVREHGGVLTAWNNEANGVSSRQRWSARPAAAGGGHGATFEILLPMRTGGVVEKAGGEGERRGKAAGERGSETAAGG